MIKSDSIKELASALCKAQSQMTVASKDSTNPHYKSKYADLASVWEAVRGPLTANGLSVSQLVSGMTLESMLMHTSGEFVCSSYPLNPVKDDPQGLRSSITYARRTSLEAIAGIAPDDDDDANMASHPVKPQPRASEKKPAAPVTASVHDNQTGTTAHNVEPKTGAAPPNVVDEMSFTGNPWDSVIKIKFTGTDLTGKKLRDLSSDELARVYKALGSLTKPGVQHKHLMNQIEKCLSGAPKETQQ